MGCRHSSVLRVIAQSFKSQPFLDRFTASTLCTDMRSFLAKITILQFLLYPCFQCNQWQGILSVACISQVIHRDEATQSSVTDDSIQAPTRFLISSKELWVFFRLLHLPKTSTHLLLSPSRWYLAREDGTNLGQGEQENTTGKVAQHVQMQICHRSIVPSQHRFYHSTHCLR